MESLPIPKTIKVYQLVRMSTKTSLSFSTTGSATVGTSGYLGTGFFTSQSEAEQNRTLETLKDTDGTNKFYVFELEFPNPIYKE